MDKKLLDILCCPVTHRGLQLAATDLLKRLNAGIAAGQVSNRDGAVLADSLDEALITDDRRILYPIQDGIPVLLEGESISAEPFVMPDADLATSPGAVRQAQLRRRSRK